MRYLIRVRLGIHDKDKLPIGISTPRVSKTDVSCPIADVLQDAFDTDIGLAAFLDRINKGRMCIGIYLLGRDVYNIVEPLTNILP